MSISILSNVRLDRDPDGWVKFAGIDMGSLGEVLAESDSTIAIRFKASKCWNGRGLPPIYVPAKIVVCEKLANKRVNAILEWDIKKASK